MAVFRSLKHKVAFSLNAYPFKKHQLQHRYIFIHIPKCAGTALRDALGDKQQNRIHLPYFAYRNACKEYYNSFFKFTVVRNPFDRIVSVYAYLKAGGNQFADKHFQDYFEQNNLTFEKFLFEYMDCQRLHAHSMFRPQFSYIFDERETLMVDYVGKQEQLSEVLSDVTARLKLSGQLRKVNESGHEHFRKYYTTPNMIDRVAELYKKDLELLDYQFE